MANLCPCYLGSHKRAAMKVSCSNSTCHTTMSLPDQTTRMQENGRNIDARHSIGAVRLARVLVVLVFLAVV